MGGAEMLRATGVAGVFLFTSIVSALAFNARVGSATINLPAPKGFCELSNSDPSEKRMLTILGKNAELNGNLMLTISADCRQLAAWDAGKRQLLDDLANYQVSPKLIDKPPEPIHATCDVLRSQGDQLTKDDTKQKQDNLAKLSDKLAINSEKFAGVLDEDARACYAAFVQKLRTELGTDRVTLTVLAITTIKQQTVFLYLQGLYEDSDPSDKLLAHTKETVAALYAANP
jgi:hypothetical protein